MRSLIADHAKTKAEYALLITAMAAGIEREYSAGGMTDADLQHTFGLILEEYRSLPDA